WVGLGGCIGSVFRYVLSGFVQEYSKRDDFPVGTLTVNILGCLIVGLLSQLSEARGAFSPETRAFVIIATLRAFTPFSTFGHETMNLWGDGERYLAFVNIVAQVMLGLGAVWLGRTIGHELWG